MHLMYWLQFLSHHVAIRNSVISISCIFVAFRYLLMNWMQLLHQGRKGARSYLLEWWPLC